jgi:cytochrome c oxidase cbb3-type subunit 1
MSVLSTDTRQTSGSNASPGELEQVERALIDASARVPVLTLFASAVFWLLVQTVIGVITSVKVQWPQFLDGCSWLTYGRLLPVQNNLMVYGWASLVGIGTALWILARLCRVALPRPGMLVAGTMLWNVALIAGSVELLSGNGRGLIYLDYPRYVFGLLFVAYSVAAVWGIILFANRRPGHVYISAWYLIAALFWFPWLVGGANLLLGSGFPGAGGAIGVVQAIVNAWYAQNLINLWFTALGLGAIYYLVPKVVGRPVHSYHLASVGFWSFAIFAVWTGGQRLIGGPIPAWVITVGIVAAIMMLIPVATVTANYSLTLKGRFNLVYHSPTIRFVFFGAVAYTLANLVLVASSFRSLGYITAFTWFGVGSDHLFIFGFYSMVMFGAMYYIIPRLVGCEWLSATFIKMHFWGTAYGWGMSIVMLLLAGFSQGLMQVNLHEVDASNAGTDFMLSVSAALPFLRGRSIAQILLCVGQLFFALNFLLMLLRLGRPSGAQPTLFAPIQEGAKS